LNSQTSCLRLLNARITGMCHHDWENLPSFIPDFNTSWPSFKHDIWFVHWGRPQVTSSNTNVKGLCLAQAIPIILMAFNKCFLLIN
jgi:hypothetical protein